jgi:hypothetical protein
MMFILLACTFWRGTFYEGGPHLRRQPMKRSATFQCLRNPGLDYAYTASNNTIINAQRIEKDVERKRSWPNLKYCSKIFAHGLFAFAVNLKTTPSQ